jgi:hypothetical protein
MPRLGRLVLRSRGRVLAFGGFLVLQSGILLQARLRAGTLSFPALFLSPHYRLLRIVVLSVLVTHFVAGRADG